jgi:hypothetical protein
MTAAAEPPPRNPFTPSFGTPPPLLVERENVIAEFEEALEIGPGAPGRAIFITGARGVGKTVVLNELEDSAKQAGWIVITDTAGPGLVDRLTHSTLPRLLREHDPRSTQSRLTMVRISSVAAEREVSEAHQPQITLRSQLEQLADLLAPHRTGVLLSLDEVHHAAINDMREVAAALQFGFREGRDIAFVAAGLPESINHLVNDRYSTFLRRAERFELAAISPPAVERALREPVEEGGRTITDKAITAAVAASDGYPYLVQSIGFYAWRAAGKAETIRASHVEEAITTARRRMEQQIHEPTLADLSPVERTFVLVMAADSGPSRIADIAERMDVGNNYVQPYRARLINAGVIRPVQRGVVDFAIPYLRSYLRRVHLGLAEAPAGLIEQAPDENVGELPRE